jgi:hypothetical protein
LLTKSIAVRFLGSSAVQIHSDDAVPPTTSCAYDTIAGDGANLEVKTSPWSEMQRYVGGAAVPGLGDEAYTGDGGEVYVHKGKDGRKVDFQYLYHTSPLAGLRHHCRGYKSRLTQEMRISVLDLTLSGAPKARSRRADGAWRLIPVSSASCSSFYAFIGRMRD